MTKLRVALACLPLVLVLAPLGCASETGEGDEGLEEVGETADRLSTPSCRSSRAAILGSVSGGRRRALDRAFSWYDAQVPYSQSKYHGGYRTDCSGYVSMCWETGPSYTTADFYAGGGESFPLGSYSELAPGDALVHRSNGAGHIVLFLGWDDTSHARACVLEENGTADDMEWGTRAVSSLKASGYRPIRADKLR
ncbi:MAG: hypothetical protein JWP87_5774 [Labilithrix sp.]|nr:hypothetical protein [Labilithrix sp.]